MINIEIKNIAQIRAAFSAAPRLMNDQFQKALTESVVLIERESMIRTPVKTGRLRASHKFSVSGSGLQMKAEVGPDVDYAIFVHDGTRFMKARPFLKEGAEASLNQIDSFFTKAVQNVFDEIGKRV